MREITANELCKILEKHEKGEKADLSNTNLRGADLIESNLSTADLRGARGYTIKQLSRVKTLYEAE